MNRNQAFNVPRMITPARDVFSGMELPGPTLREPGLKFVSVSRYRQIHRLAVFLLVLVGFIVAGTPRSYAQKTPPPPFNPKRHVTVPVVVNVLKGAKISKQDMTAIIKAANKILKAQLNIEFQLDV